MNKSNTRSLRLFGAYGRRYKTAEEALRAWNDGKDFKMYDGPYCSVRDVAKLREDGYTELRICYDSDKFITEYLDSVVAM